MPFSGSSVTVVSAILAGLILKVVSSSLSATVTFAVASPTLRLSDYVISLCSIEPAQLSEKVTDAPVAIADPV